MRKGRCSDNDGFFLEMFLYCGTENLQILCKHLNDIMHEQTIPEKWCDTSFDCCIKEVQQKTPTIGGRLLS